MAELSIRTLPYQTKFVAVDHSAAGCSYNAEGMGLGPEIINPPERPWGECLVGSGGRDLACHVEILERIWVAEQQVAMATETHFMSKEEGKVAVVAAARRSDKEAGTDRFNTCARTGNYM